MPYLSDYCVFVCVYVCEYIYPHINNKRTSIQDLKSMTIFKPLEGKFEKTFVSHLFCSTNQVHI